MQQGFSVSHKKQRQSCVKAQAEIDHSIFNLVLAFQHCKIMAILEERIRGQLMVINCVLIGEGTAPLHLTHISVGNSEINVLFLHH